MLFAEFRSHCLGLVLIGSMLLCFIITCYFSALFFLQHHYVKSAVVLVKSPFVLLKVPTAGTSLSLFIYISIYLFCLNKSRMFNDSLYLHSLLTHIVTMCQHGTSWGF